MIRPSNADHHHLSCGVRATIAACFLTLAVGPMVALDTLGFLPGPGTVQAQFSGNSCINDGQGNPANCTSNDGSIANVYEGDISSRCEEFPDDFIVGTFFVEIAPPSAQNRYDWGVYFSEDGDPIRRDFSDMNVDPTGCYVEILHPVAPVGSADPAAVDGQGPFFDLETNNVDVCGDLSKDFAFNTIFLTTAEAMLPCDDLNLDGFVDIQWCVGFDNNAVDDCTSISDFQPGTPSKCSCGTVQTDSIPTGPAAVEITKDTLSQTLVSGPVGGLYTYDVTFQVRVQNTGFRDLEEVVITDSLTSAFTGATIVPASVSASITDSDFSFGGTRTPVCDVAADPAYDGDTNIDLTLSGSCLAHDDVNLSGVGDYVVFEIDVTIETTCAATYTNTAYVEAQPDTGIDNPTGGEPINGSASSDVVCGPLAVDLVDLEARSTLPGQGMLAILVAVAVAGMALIFFRRRDVLVSG